MPRLEFILRLTSDAEPGTGLGTELVNDLIPRDRNGRATIPGSHFKGLLRDRWRILAPHAGPKNEHRLESLLFGAEFQSSEQQPAEAVVLHIGDLIWKTGATEVHLVARTRINEPGHAAEGTAAETSLRITEAIPCGTTFTGTMILSNGSPQVLAALQLCLLSLEAVGGGRRRGSGCCVVEHITLDGKDTNDSLSACLAATLSPGASTMPPGANPAILPISGAMLLTLTFHADQPVLCPEHPEAGNTLRGAAVIPASAIQGALISRIAARYGSAAAETLINDDTFRAWPMLPSGFRQSEGLAQVVPLSLRQAKDASKAQQAGTPSCQDVLLRADGDGELEAPKNMSGSLVSANDGSMRYLAAKDLPHLVRAQVNLDDRERTGVDKGPKLFSVEAVGPCCWSGLLRLPKSYEAAVKDILKEGLTIGRKRSVFGGGTWSATAAPDLVPITADRIVVVLQSPVLVPIELGTPMHKSPLLPNDLLRQVIERDPAWQSLGLTWSSGLASLSIRFGWNRHGRSRGLQEPYLVVVPGSVAVLTWNAGSARDLVALRQAVLNGLGSGRKDGFGAVRLHPLTAKDIRVGNPITQDKTPPSKMVESDALLSWALGWASRPDELPSPSQIAQVSTMVATGDVTRVNRHIDQQMKRPQFQGTLKPLLGEVRKKAGGMKDDHRARPTDHFWEEVCKKAGEMKDDAGRNSLLNALRIVQDIAIALRTDDAK